MNHLSLQYRLRKYQNPIVRGQPKSKTRKLLNGLLGVATVSYSELGQVYHDFIVDGKSLQDQINEIEELKDGVRFGYISLLACDSWYSPGSYINAQKELLAERKSELPDNYVPLLLCPLCGDPGCGMVIFKIEKQENQIIWSDFRWYTGYWDEGRGEYDSDDEWQSGEDNKILIGPFTFPWDEYEKAIKAAKEYR